MSHSFMSGNSQNRLRSVDRVIRDILWHHPDAPRPLDDPWYPMRNWLYIGSLMGLVAVVLLLLHIGPWLIHQVRTGDIWHSRYITSLLSPVLIILLVYIVVHPLYDWWVGIRHGRPTIAVVQRIYERPAITSVRGTWKIWVDSREVELPFRHYTLEDGTWIQALCEGDQIHVLLHPTKPKVLLAYGP